MRRPCMSQIGTASSLDGDRVHVRQASRECQIGIVRAPSRHRMCAVVSLTKPRPYAHHVL